MNDINKHTRYEDSAQRKQILSVRSSKGDDSSEWDAIVTWLKRLGDGKAKDGLYRLAKKNKVI